MYCSNFGSAHLLLVLCKSKLATNQNNSKRSLSRREIAQFIHCIFELCQLSLFPPQTLSTSILHLLRHHCQGKIERLKAVTINIHNARSGQVFMLLIWSIDAQKGGSCDRGEYAANRSSRLPTSVSQKSTPPSPNGISEVKAAGSGSIVTH